MTSLFFFVRGPEDLFSVVLLGVPCPDATADDAAPAACADSGLGTRSTCSESIDLNGRVGAFQCKLRRGRRATKSSCINPKTPDGSWYSTVKSKRCYDESDQGVCAPVTFELESPSITVGSAGVCLEASSATPRAGVSFPATLMKHARDRNTKDN